VVALSSNGRRKPFLKKRLSRAALIIFAVAIFVPWSVKFDAFFSSSYYWSFMVDYHHTELRRGFDFPSFANYNGQFFLTDFWFGNFIKLYNEGSSSTASLAGLNIGWFLVFFFQVSTLTYFLAQLIKPSLSKRNVSALLIVLFASASLLFGVFQCVVQSNIEYAYNGGNSSSIPYFGFIIAAISASLLLGSFLRSSESSALKIHWKRIVGILILLSIVGFYAFNELSFQTGVTKQMLVEKNVQAGELPRDPAKWDADLNNILAVANVFRARMTDNTPEYYYCSLEVPAASYNALSVLLGSMGYVAIEPGFVSLYLER